MSPPLVTLLSDFGERDGYAGAMKGAVLSVCPNARLVDLSHAIPPGDVRAGARVLAAAAPYYPAGSVHLAVVDPGVGSERRAVAVQVDGQRYVAPDNGLLTEVIEGASQLRVHALARPALWRAEISAVFHGRDVFAPVAGHLAGGLDLEEVGPAVEASSLVRLCQPEVRREAGRSVGEVVAVDGFGNLITNLRLERHRAPEALVEVAGRRLSPCRTYSDAPEGALLALIGSSGRLEIAVNRGSAAQTLGASTGLVVVLRASRGDST